MKRTSLLTSFVVIIIGFIVGYLLIHKSPAQPVHHAPPSRANNQSSNDQVVLTKNSASLGSYLVEPNGQPLYIYGGDTSGVSNCTGSCLSSWPAYQDKGSTTHLPSGIGTIKRRDNGQIQYTYNGLPLYTFVDDSTATPTGNNVMNFSLARPSNSQSSSPSSQPSTAPSSNNSYYNQ